MQNSTTAVSLGASMNDDLETEQDENLMLRYRDGDAAAFEVLYSRHKNALFRYFSRQCPEATIAEELFQDSWMSIIKSRKNYITSAKFKTYMYTIAHNKLVDFYRRNKSNITDSLNLSSDNNDNESAVDELPARKKDQPEQIMLVEQKRGQLLSAIKRLPEVQREVFLLREESGLNLNEIASILDVKRETAKSRLRYAVKSLTKIIKQVIHE